MKTNRKHIVLQLTDGIYLLFRQLTDSIISANLLKQKSPNYKVIGVFKSGIDLLFRQLTNMPIRQLTDSTISTNI